MVLMMTVVKIVGMIFCLWVIVGCFVTMGLVFWSTRRVLGLDQLIRETAYRRTSGQVTTLVLVMLFSVIAWPVPLVMAFLNRVGRVRVERGRY